MARNWLGSIFFSFISTKIFAEAVCEFPPCFFFVDFLHKCVPTCLVTVLSLLRIDLRVYMELFICEAFMQFCPLPQQLVAANLTLLILKWHNLTLL